MITRSELIHRLRTEIPIPMDQHYPNSYIDHAENTQVFPLEIPSPIWVTIPEDLYEAIEFYDLAYMVE